MEVLIRPERPDDFDKMDEFIEAAFNQKNEAVLVRALRGTCDFIP
jgi:predicted N-acetyltransferase YhbS